jgi:hypothetical protein
VRGRLLALASDSHTAVDGRGSNQVSEPCPAILSGEEANSRILLGLGIH